LIDYVGMMLTDTCPGETVSSLGQQYYSSNLTEQNGSAYNALAAIFMPNRE